METHCEGLLCDRRIAYKWSLKKRRRANVWPEWEETLDLDDVLLTYQDSPNLVTKENKLQANATYRLEVIGKTNEGFSSFAFQEFTTNSPPYGGQCSVDKKEGERACLLALTCC